MSLSAQELEVVSHVQLQNRERNKNKTVLTGQSQQARSLCSCGIYQSFFLFFIVLLFLCLPLHCKRLPQSGQKIIIQASFDSLFLSQSFFIYNYTSNFLLYFCPQKRSFDCSLISPFLCFQHHFPIQLGVQTSKQYKQGTAKKTRLSSPNRNQKLHPFRAFNWGQFRGNSFVLTCFLEGVLGLCLQVLHFSFIFMIKFGF